MQLNLPMISLKGGFDNIHSSDRTVLPVFAFKRVQDRGVESGHRERWKSKDSVTQDKLGLANRVNQREPLRGLLPQKLKQ